MSADSLTITTTLLGGISTIAIFSFLIRENPLFRFFEHLFIGIATGLGSVLVIKNFLWPKILVPMFGLDIDVYPDGSLSKEYDPLVLLYLLPLAVGLLYYTIFSRRFSWLAKVPIGIALGASAGLAFKGFFNEMIPQLVGSFKPLVVVVQGEFDRAQSASNLVFVLSLLAVMYYFFFSFRSSGKSSSSFSVAGRWVMMVCFGAFFGSTVMARMAILVERVDFLVNRWWEALRALW